MFLDGSPWTETVFHFMISFCRLLMIRVAAEIQVATFSRMFLKVMDMVSTSFCKISGFSVMIFKSLDASTDADSGS